MSENRKAFIWGIVVGAILCGLYVLWSSAQYNYPSPLSDEETQLLQTSIENYTKQVAQP